MAVETAMVSANCRKNVPVMPAIKAVGINTEQSNGDRDQGNDRRTPGLEKNQDDENDKRDRFEQRFLHFVDRFTDRNCWVVNNRVVESGRETLFKFGHFLPNRVGSGERI